MALMMKIAPLSTAADSIVKFHCGDDIFVDSPSCEGWLGSPPNSRSKEMKILLLVACVLLSATAAKTAEPPRPVLTKATYGGMMLPLVQTNCDVYDDRIESEKTVRQQSGKTAKSHSVRRISVSLQSLLNELLYQASLGQVTREPGHPDSGGSFYSANVLVQTGGYKSLELMTTGASIVTNNSPGAIALVGFLDSNCPR